MKEMLYGNNGTNDESMNVDMEQDLYQKIQNIKSNIRNFLDVNTSEFVYIGEVISSGNKFSVYGFNSKLKSDNRGGSYGHFIAKPIEGMYGNFDITDVKFIDESGFIEYANSKVLNNEKKFAIVPQTFDINENVKKKTVCYLMETFMSIRKREYVAFSFDETDAEQFLSQSVYILGDILKYLPYHMRKNVSFVSRAVSSDKIPSGINLIAYSNSVESKPSGCINLNEITTIESDSPFASYAEKIFAMTDKEREQYFELIFEEIEKPAIEHNLNVNSNLYLLDLEKKELWTNGNEYDAINDIFNSITNIILIYPVYKELAQNFLLTHEDVAANYIKEMIDECKSPDELKEILLKLIEVKEATCWDAVSSAFDYFKAKSTELMDKAESNDNFIKVAIEVNGISEDFIDQQFVIEKINSTMLSQMDIHSIYSFYLKVMEAGFVKTISEDCVRKAIENLIERKTDSIPEYHYKSETLETMYIDFQKLCTDESYPLVTEIYNSYKNRFDKAADDKTMQSGTDAIDSLEKKVKKDFSPFEALEYIQELGQIDEKALIKNDRRASRVYEKISQKIFDEIVSETPETYEDFKSVINEIYKYVEKLERSQIYDAGKNFNGKADGLYDFIVIFGSLISNVGNAESLQDVVFYMGKAESDVNERKSERFNKTFEIYAPIIFKHWVKKNKHLPNSIEKKKAQHALKKQNATISENVWEIVDNEIETNKSNRSVKTYITYIASGIIIVALIAAIVVICIKKFGVSSSDTINENENHTNSEQQQQDKKNEKESNTDDSKGNKDKATDKDASNADDSKGNKDKATDKDASNATDTKDEANNNGKENTTSPINPETKSSQSSENMKDEQKQKQKQ